jgi:hypothetical protein
VIKKNGKKWFLTPELAIGHKLYKIIVWELLYENIHL